MTNIVVVVAWKRVGFFLILKLLLEWMGGGVFQNIMEIKGFLTSQIKDLAGIIDSLIIYCHT